MRPPLVVVTSRDYWKRIKWICVAIAPFLALGIANVVDRWRSAQRDMALAMIAITVFIGLAPMFMLWARTRWVHRFDERGVTLRNGRHFAWADFQRVEPVRNRKLRMTNHYDLVFSTGRAGVFHLMAKNAGDVLDVIRALEHGANPFVS